MKFDNRLATILLLLVLLSCLVLAGGYMTGSNHSPVGTVYVSSTSTVNHTAVLSLVDSTLLNLGNFSNVTFWHDIGGTWVNNQTNHSALDGEVGFAVTGFKPADDGVVHWNLLAGFINGSTEWVFSSNKSYDLDFFAVNGYSLEPSVDSFVSSSTPTINVTFQATDSPLTCCLFVNDVQEQCIADIANNTKATFGGASSGWSLSEGSNDVFFNCTKVTSGIYNVSETIVVKYDATAPAVTVNAPSDNYVEPSQSLVINLTTVDKFNVNCSIWHNINDATWHKNVTLGMTNATDNVTTISNLGNDFNGATWGYRCLDEQNNLAAANFTVYVDNTTVTEQPSCVSPVNNTRSTDYSPTLTWTAVVDTSFASYKIHLLNSSLAEVYTYTITDNSTVSLEITDDLSADQQWYWNISVFDIAGNSNVSDNCTSPFWYYPDSVGHTLLSGYNFFSIVRNTDSVSVSASQLCSEPSVTPVSVSKYNSSQAWETHVCGTSSGNFTLNELEPVVINMPSAGTWETGRSWDLVNSTMPMFNISSGWNLVGIPFDATFSEIDAGNVNHSVQGYTSDKLAIRWMSYPDHTQTYVPFRANWSFNANVNLFNGDALWLFLNDTTMFLNRTTWEV